LEKIGKLVKDNDIRISMHPDQFVLINSEKKDVVSRSISELIWHCELLDLMGLDFSAKVQIHVGGVYGDKKSAMGRFIKNYNKLPELVRKRLAIENDERLYSLKDCLNIYKKVGVPIIFDVFHHTCLNNGETVNEAVYLASKTWEKTDGILMIDYSSQEPNSKFGKHINNIDVSKFTEFIESTIDFNFDIMLEIKDKEASALKAIQIVNKIRI
jgi:UV DNA damage endonuclease